MARYILIEIPDNDEADAIVKAVESDGVIYSVRTPDSETEMRYESLSGAKVEALWAKPTMFCECPKPGDRSGTSKKYGWYVHVDCAKPKRGVYQHPRNLLEPPEMDVRKRRYYLGFRSDPNWTWVPQDGI